MVGNLSENVQVGDTSVDGRIIIIIRWGFLIVIGGYGLDRSVSGKGQLLAISE
jgi:hypothetical protein